MEEILKELKNNNENFSSEYSELMKEYYQKMMTQPEQRQNIPGINQPDEEGGMIIVPKPYCCVKTLDKNSQKVFINITAHEKIEAPKEENILEVDHQFGVRVPMSLSEKAEDFDAKLGACMVYDAIFNPRVLDQSEKDPTLFQFVVSIVIDRIFQRFKHELSTSFTRMKNFTYKGKNIRPQRVKVRKGPKIEEVFMSDSGTNRDADFLNNRNLAREVNKQINENSKTPSWNLMIIKNQKINLDEMRKVLGSPSSYLNRRFSFKEFEENEKNDLLFFDNSNANPKYGYGFLYLIELNLLAKSSGMHLNVSDDGFILTCGSIYKLLISVPYRVEAEKTYSYFDSNNRFLYVFLSFYKDDVIKFRNQLIKELDEEEQKGEYTEIVKIGVKAKENGNLKENGIDKSGKDKENKSADPESIGDEEKPKKEKLEDITAKISDDYLYDVIV